MPQDGRSDQFIRDHDCLIDLEPIQQNSGCDFSKKKLTNLIYLGNIIAKRISERKKEIKTDRQRERERERETDRQREREEKTSGSPDSFNVINVTALLLFHLLEYIS